MAPLIIYGATGYTGRLASEYAKSLGVDFSIAGRTESTLKDMATVLGVRYCVFDVNQTGLVDSTLKTTSVLLNCAGPFVRTAKPLMEACIRNKVYYLDISAELESYQQAKRLDEAACKANVMLLPGCGGSVAMLGCLASHVVEQVEDPIQIEIALRVAGTMSRGSAISAAESITSECLQMFNGDLIKQEVSKTTQFDFDDGNEPVTAFPLTLPDLITLQRSTSVSNIGTFVHVSGDSFPVGDLASLPDGPTTEQRKAAPYHAAVKVTSQTGACRHAVLHTVNGYTFTSVASVQAAMRVLVHQMRPGFQTPAGVFGKDFVRSVPGSEIRDL